MSPLGRYGRTNEPSCSRNNTHSCDSGPAHVGPQEKRFVRRSDKPIIRYGPMLIRDRENMADLSYIYNNNTIEVIIGGRRLCISHSGDPWTPFSGVSSKSRNAIGELRGKMINHQAGTLLTRISDDAHSVGGDVSVDDEAPTLTHARHPPPEKRDFGALEAIEMVPDGSVKDQEASSSSSPPAAAIARAARPPRPVSFKTKRIVWHPLKHRRFRVGATKTMVEASSSAQAVRGAREVGEATTAAAAMGSPKEDEKGHICGGWKSEDGSLYCGYSSLRGRRASMEDFYDMRSSKMGAKNINLFGVFDGHGGSCAAEYLKEHLFENLLKHPSFITDTKTAISESYTKTDSDFLDAETNIHREDGSTASTAIFVGNHLYVANVGDSRAVISKAGKAIALSDDHKPDRSDERERIENAGGVVTFSGTWRVGGVLAMSRAFGDRLLKPFVVAEPEIQEQEIDDELEYLILASDGLWDVVSNEHAVAFVKEEVGPEAAARKLTQIAFARGSTDNITCIVVEFHRAK
ncbi:hypothetical protein VPH35_060014 [Triticum aestivum]|nr:probable protein phosphatase 2C 7 [Triticum aestivum]